MGKDVEWMGDIPFMCSVGYALVYRVDNQCYRQIGTPTAGKGNRPGFGRTLKIHFADIFKLALG